MQEFPAEQVAEIQGTPVYDTGGNKIGSVDDVFLDNDTGKPEWLGVAGGLLSSSKVLIPVHGARFEGDAIAVPYTKDHVKASPEIKGDEISQQTEQELYAYYGLDYGESRSDTGLPEGGAGGGETDDAMTRSEEELRVGKATREAGRARLRKYIVSEPVETTVPVQREQVRIEREPITDANVDEATSGPELSEEEHEVVLREEEVVAEKRVVPKERVRLDKDVSVEEQRVSDEVRKERIEAEEDPRP